MSTVSTCLVCNSSTVATCSSIPAARFAFRLCFIRFVFHVRSCIWCIGWLVGCFGFNGPLRQYFSLYRAVSQREGERRERIDESKNVQGLGSVEGVVGWCDGAG